MKATRLLTVGIAILCLFVAQTAWAAKVVGATLGLTAAGLLVLGAGAAGYQQLSGSEEAALATPANASTVPCSALSRQPPESRRLATARANSWIVRFPMTAEPS